MIDISHSRKDKAKINANIVAFASCGSRSENSGERLD